MPKLLEGFTSQVATGVRQFFARAAEADVASIARGGTPGVERMGLPYSISAQSGYEGLHQQLQVDANLNARYADYEEMDEFGEISTALDIYADDATTTDMESGQAIWATSESKAFENDLNDMLKRIGAEDNIWGETRTLAKYGNNYGEILVTQSGVVGVNHLPVATMRRMEGPRGGLLGFIQDIRGQFNVTLDDFYRAAQKRAEMDAAGQQGVPGFMTVFEDWEVVHWRLRGKKQHSIYGHGVIDPARWAWKRLALLEDALLIAKLSRVPRYVYYVDVGEYDAERGMTYVNRVKNQFKKRKFVNPSTNKIDMRHNPLAHDEDIFIATRGGKDSTRIDVLQGLDYAETDTVEYHRDKLVSNIKVPKVYMGWGGESVKGQLSSEDVRFARTVMRIQREMRNGYKKIGRVHLIAKGADPEASEFDMEMSVSSAIMELAQMEVLGATADVAQRLGETLPAQWILTKLYKFSEEEAEQMMRTRHDESILRAKLEAYSQSLLNRAADPTQPPVSEFPWKGATGTEVIPVKGGPEQKATPAGGEAAGGEAVPAKESEPMTIGAKDRMILERMLSRAVEEHSLLVERSMRQTMRISSDEMYARVSKLMEGDRRLAQRMNQTGALLRDIRMSMRGRDAA